jgi:Type II secretion system (T2SS), protein E, N-terminal domain
LEDRVTHRIPIGQMLVQAGRIDAGQLACALAHQQQRGGRLGEALVALRLVTEQALLSTLAQQHGVRYVWIGEQSVPPEIVRLVPPAFIRARRILPLALAPNMHRGKLFVAASAPIDPAALDELALLTGMTVRAVLVGEGDLDRAIARHVGLGAADAPPVARVAPAAPAERGAPASRRAV